MHQFVKDDTIIIQDSNRQGLIHCQCHLLISIQMQETLQSSTVLGVVTSQTTIIERL